MERRSVMEIYEALSTRIIILCNKEDLSLYQLSKLTGIPKTTLKDIVSCKIKNTAMNKVEKISKAFNLSMRDFFDSDIFD